MSMSKTVPEPTYDAVRSLYRWDQHQYASDMTTTQDYRDYLS